MTQENNKPTAQVRTTIVATGLVRSAAGRAPRRLPAIKIDMATTTNPENIRIMSPEISTTAPFRLEVFGPKADSPERLACSPLMGSNFAAR